MNPKPGRTWINFRELRAKLKFEEVLRHYKVEIRRRGSQHQGPCPLPKHTGPQGTPCFSANLDRGIFQCFGCKAKGNVLEFAALMEGVDVTDGDALRTVAFQLQSRFLPEGSSTKETPKQSDLFPVAPRDVPVVTNAPLDFELKGLDWGHEYLMRRSFTVEAMRHFGVGFCARGILTGRIAIPLHDADGHLLGFAGRVVDDSTICESNPKYLFPSRRERNGTIYAFDKSLFVYNASRIKVPCDDLVVVQGFASVWWLYQHGYRDAVALMGAECSEAQTEAIISLVSSPGRLWLMTDGSDAGDALARVVVGRFARRRFLRWVRLNDGRQATDLSPSELSGCFKT